jgi:hypothetical protein
MGARYQDRLADRPSVVIKLQLQLQLQSIGELMRFSHCKLLLLEAESPGWRQFGNPEERNISRWKPVASNGSEDMTVDCVVCDSEL